MLQLVVHLVMTGLESVSGREYLLCSVRG